jgi:N-acetylglucosamine-6-sulfatase
VVEGVWPKSLIFIALMCLVVVPASRPDKGALPSERPNILFILTDDLDERTAGRMPGLQDQLAARGTTFDQAFVTTPQCCPSRASFMTGKYTHNHTVYTNGPPEGGAPKFRSSGEDESTVATWLDAQGYETILIGKYLNVYDGTYVPPGWDEWRGQMGQVSDQKFNINGTTKYFDPETYHDTDLFSGWATDYIRQGAGRKEPFFMYLAVNAPHGPDDGAPRDEHKFREVHLPRTPSFNEENVGDKPAWIRNKPRLQGEDIEELTARYRDRLRSLRSVNQMIERLIVELRATGELENTYIVFTSDNGYHLGQHRLPHGKATAYEEDISVPLYVRGPGVPAGRTLEHRVLNLDFAATFAELGGARVPATTDGRSFVPLLDNDPPPSAGWRQSFLVEFYLGHPYSALCTGEYTYVEYDNGQRELYDLQADPYQLRSLHASSEHRALMKRLHARLEALRDCSGQESCEAAENAFAAR